MVALLAAVAIALSPPLPVLRSGGDHLTAARGSSCWFADGQGVCADTLPPVTKGSLLVRPGGRIGVDMRRPADSLSARLRGQRPRRLRVRRGDDAHFTIRVPGGMKRPRVLDLFARYPEGDGAFGARLTVP